MFPSGKQLLMAFAIIVVSAIAISLLIGFIAGKL